MNTALLPFNEMLARQSRTISVGPSAASGATALCTLVGFGVIAAGLSICVEMKLRIPGHAILRAVFPMAAGLALAPRGRGGTVMGLSAMLAAVVLKTIGFKTGAGSLASLALIGPCLDICLYRAKGGWRLYGSFVAAGMICNLTAFFIRTGAKLGGLDALGAQPLAIWLKPALFSYLICGALAGLVSAFVWFRIRPSQASSAPSSPSA